jgi:formate dehydrogenase subunit gamma
LTAVVILLGVLYAGSATMTASPSLNVNASLAQEQAPPPAMLPGGVPGNALGNVSDAQIWRAVREGVTGTVSIPDQKAGLLVQTQGEEWRGWRNGPIAVVGAIAFWVMFFVIFGFYNIRGKVRVSHGLSGRTILRFEFIERFSHWLVAGSFLILAATGVNMLYGKHVIIPIFGKEFFSTITQLGKYVHNYVGFAFILGLVLIFFLWVKENLWDEYDWGWIKKGGGLLIETEHPKAKKFNFGQKTVFWMVIIGGGALSLTGINLMFPFIFTDLGGLQWSQAIHATLSQVMCLLMLAHIYIGTIGMEQSFVSMSTGEVDENWAKEHHSVWYDELKNDQRGTGKNETPSGMRQAPAE